MSQRDDAITYVSHILQSEIISLATSLGVSPESLARLRIGKNVARNVYTFPLRQPNGFIVGTSNRPIAEGDHKSVTGQGASRGLMGDPDGLSPDYLIIAEGASDTAAVISAGFSSVVGKQSACAGTAAIVQLSTRLSPRLIINLRDADKQGLAGHNKLKRAMRNRSIIELVPDPGYKDAREWYMGDPIGMHNAIASHLERIDLPESAYNLPGRVVLADYQDVRRPSISFQLGSYVEPEDPDFQLGAKPIYLPDAVPTTTTSESSSRSVQSQPVLDRSRVQFFARIGNSPETIVSDEVDHTDTDSLEDFISDWSRQLEINPDNLRAEIPSAIECCLSAAFAHQRQIARLDSTDPNPERVDSTKENLEKVAAWCKAQLRIFDNWNERFQIIKLADIWYEFKKESGYTELSSDEFDARMLTLIQRAVKCSTIGYRKEICAYLKAELALPKDLQLGQWIPDVTERISPDMPINEYEQLLHDFPSEEMLATPSGLVNLPSVDLNYPDYIPYSPSWLGAVTTTVSIEPYAQCPGWISHLDLAFGTSAQGIQNRIALQDWFGYCLMPHARLNKFCILHGASQSGKSTCLLVLSALVKTASMKAADLGQEFGLENLAGFTHAAFDEFKVIRTNEATSRLLSITGNMPTPIPRKYKTKIDTHPALKLTMTANAMPEFDNNYNSIGNRIHPIFFPRTIPVNERQAGIGVQWIENELGGILNWAIEGYQRVYAANRLSVPGSYAQSIALLDAESNPFASFVAECLIDSVGLADPHIRVSDTFAAYRGHCHAINVKALTRKEMVDTLLNKNGFDIVHPTNHHTDRAERIRDKALSEAGRRFAADFEFRNRRGQS